MRLWQDEWLETKIISVESPLPDIEKIQWQEYWSERLPLPDHIVETKGESNAVAG